MEKFVPYVNVETVKDKNGNIERFEVRTVTYLPQGSKIATSGEGALADNVLYRPLTISYDGTSAEFDYFGADFTIQRKDVGLLERGVNVNVKSTAIFEARAMAMDSAELRGDEGDAGLRVEYDDPIIPD